MMDISCGTCVWYARHRTVRDFQLLLWLLAERVYTARSLRDASDFHAWLQECAELAGSSATFEEFFDQLT
jgi:hypothetical protein